MGNVYYYIDIHKDIHISRKSNALLSSMEGIQLFNMTENTFYYHISNIINLHLKHYQYTINAHSLCVQFNIY